MRAVPILLLALTLTPLHAQNEAPMQPPSKAAKTSKTGKPKLSPPTKPVPLAPLTQQEKALQLLNRFTFGPRPGDVVRVLALTPEKWFEQQLNPQTINDDVLNKRLNDYPTLTMQPDQALLQFPDRGTIQSVADGKRPMPSDPNLAAVYEVQIYKLNKDNATKKINADGKPAVTPPTDAELADQKKQDQATAARIAGDLFTLPKNAAHGRPHQAPRTRPHSLHHLCCRRPAQSHPRPVHPPRAPDLQRHGR